MDINKALKNPWIIRGLAVVIAISMWVFVINDGFRSGFLDTKIPVKAHNLQSDYSVVNDLGEVKIKLRAPASTWQQLSPDSIEAYVDLAGLEEGFYTREIKYSIDDPSVTVTLMEPEEIEVEIQGIVEAEKEITLEPSGDLGEGYIYDDPEFSKSRVKIKGGLTPIEKVDRVVAPIQFNSEMSEIKETVELMAIDADGNQVTNVVILPKTVDVTIPIHKEKEVKNVGIKANVTGEPRAGYYITKINLNPGTVSLKGDQEKLNELEVITTEAISVAGATSEVTKEVGFELPEGIETVNGDRVTITIEIGESILSKDIFADFVTKNLEAGLVAERIEPSSAAVNIEGSEVIINQVQSNDFSIVIDLNGKNAGTYDIPVTNEMVSGPGEVKVNRIGVGSVKVTIGK